MGEIISQRVKMVRSEVSKQEALDYFLKKEMSIRLNLLGFGGWDYLFL